MIAAMAERLVAFFITVAATFIGASAAFVFALWKSYADRRADFRRQQLAEFYSPIAGYARRIHALLAMSQRVLGATENAWSEALRSHGGKYTKDLEPDKQRFAKIYDYENAQVDAELLPSYRAILARFTEKYWLAEPETRGFYENYYAFVDHWNRVKNESLPIEVRHQIPHDAEAVRAFFTNVETTLQRLQEHLR